MVKVLLLDFRCEADFAFEVCVAYGDESPRLTVRARRSGRRSANRLFDKLFRDRFGGEVPNAPAAVEQAIKILGSLPHRFDWKPFWSVGNKVGHVGDYKGARDWRKTVLTARSKLPPGICDSPQRPHGVGS